ncbi:MAG: putative Ig domain-containing protein [Bacteroidota bacterium]
MKNIRNSVIFFLSFMIVFCADPSKQDYTHITIQTTNKDIPDAYLEKYYSYQVMATGKCTLSYSWEALSGELPSDLFLNEQTGIISGLISYVPDQPYNLRLTVTDTCSANDKSSDFVDVNLDVLYISKLTRISERLDTIQIDVPGDLGNVAKVTAGGLHTCALDEIGLYCWGHNYYGQTDIPVYLGSITNIAAGMHHTCALDENRPYCWGNNDYNQLDVPVADLGLVTDITAAGSYTCALDENGIHCWGDNKYGQTDVPLDLGSVIDIATGPNHACALDENGVYCWGDNHYGQTDVPINLGNVTSIVAGGGHTCALDENAVRCWGYNENGQTDVPDGLGSVTKMAAGTYHTCALEENGVFCWGCNEDSEIPTDLGIVADITAGANHTCALDENGVHCWTCNGEITEGDWSSWRASISDNARYIAFSTLASNLGPIDSDVVDTGNRQYDIYLKDMLTGKIELISKSTEGIQGGESDDDSNYPSISGDGRYVVFESLAMNLVPSDTTGSPNTDIFIRDRQEQTTIRIEGQGGEPNNACLFPWIGNGTFVSFNSWATNMINDEESKSSSDPVEDVILYEMETGKVRRISQPEEGIIYPDNNYNHHLTFNRDATVLVFKATGELISEDTNGIRDIYLSVRDGDNSILECLTCFTEADPVAGSNGSAGPTITWDGRYIVFMSDAVGFMENDTNHLRDVFVYDSVFDAYDLVSVSSEGEQANAPCGYESPSISQDGRYVVYTTEASNLVDHDTNEKYDVFVFDRITRKTERISVGDNGYQSVFPSVLGTITPDGRYIMFRSDDPKITGTNTSSYRRTDFYITLNPLYEKE